MKKLFGIFLIFVCGMLVLPLNYTFAQEDDVSFGDEGSISISRGEDETEEEPEGAESEDTMALEDKATIEITPAEEVNPLDKENLGRFVSDIKSIYKQQRQETIQIIKDCRAELNNSDPNQRSDIRQQCRVQLDELKEQYKEVRKSIRDAIIEFKHTYKMSMRDVAEDPPDISGSENDEMKEKVSSAQNKIKQFKSDRG